jgi:hypothetical protein
MAYVMKYAIYGVTIAEADALMAVPPTAGVSQVGLTANQSGFLEPPLRSRRGNQLVIDYSYTKNLTLTLVRSDDMSLLFNSNHLAVTTTVLVDDRSNGAGKQGSLVVPSHAAWTLLYENLGTAETFVTLNVGVME